MFLVVELNESNSLVYSKGALFIYGQEKYDGIGVSESNGGVILNWGSNSILWYTIFTSNNASKSQFNNENSNYIYAAIG